MPIGFESHVLSKRLRYRKKEDLRAHNSADVTFLKYEILTMMMTSRDSSVLREQNFSIKIFLNKF